MNSSHLVLVAVCQDPYGFSFQVWLMFRVTKHLLSIAKLLSSSFSSVFCLRLTVFTVSNDHSLRYCVLFVLYECSRSVVDSNNAEHLGSLEVSFSLKLPG